MISIIISFFIVCRSIAVRHITTNGVITCNIENIFSSDFIYLSIVFKSTSITDHSFCVSLVQSFLQFSDSESDTLMVKLQLIGSGVLDGRELRSSTAFWDCRFVFYYFKCCLNTCRHLSRSQPKPLKEKTPNWSQITGLGLNPLDKVTTVAAYTLTPPPHEIN